MLVYNIVYELSLQHCTVEPPLTGTLYNRHPLYNRHHTSPSYSNCVLIDLSIKGASFLKDTLLVPNLKCPLNRGSTVYELSLQQKVKYTSL